MTSPTLPGPVQAVVDAINAADTDAFVAAFTEDGFVSDWGRVLNGADGIRSWADTDAIGQRLLRHLAVGRAQLADAVEAGKGFGRDDGVARDRKDGHDSQDGHKGPGEVVSRELHGSFLSGG